MGLYLEQPVDSDRLENCHALPSSFTDVPAGKYLIIEIGYPHRPLWIITDEQEFARMQAHMSDPAFERNTIWYFCDAEYVHTQYPSLGA